MSIACDVIDTVRREEPDLFDAEFDARVAEARQYLQLVADQGFVRLGMPRQFGSSNRFGFMELQDVQELANFFERTVSAYQTGVEGTVSFDEDF